MRQPITTDQRPQYPPAQGSFSQHKPQTHRHPSGCSSVPALPTLPRVDHHSHKRRCSDSAIFNRSLTHPATTTSAPLKPARVNRQPARDRAQAFIDQRDKNTQALFEGNGLTAERLTPLCHHLGDKCTDAAIWSSLDKVRFEIVNAPDEGNLRHHTPHRIALGAVALFGNGSNRFFGVGGLSRFLPGPASVTNPLSLAITILSYCSDGLQGAFGTNRIGMDGLSRNWKDWFIGITAFTSAASIAGMAAFGILNLAPLSPGLALGAGIIAAMKLVGSMPFYYLLAKNFYDTMAGRDGKNEQRLEDSVWLAARTLEKLGDDIDLNDTDEAIVERLKAYSDTLCLDTDLESRRCKALRLAVIRAPGDRAKNIISDLRKNTAIENRSIKALAASAVTVHSLSKKALLASSFLGIAVFTGLSGWGEAASVINPLVKATAPHFASGIAASAAALCQLGGSTYAIWQMIFATMMAGRSLGQAALVQKNIRALKDARQYFRELCRCRDREEMKVFVRKLFTHGLGVASSLAYTLSFIGAIYTNANNDLCIGNNPNAALALAFLGAAPMLMATLFMGRELDAIFVAAGQAAMRMYRRIQDRWTGVAQPSEPWFKMARHALNTTDTLTAAPQDETESRPLLTDNPLDDAIHRVRQCHIETDIHSRVSNDSAESWTKF